MASLAYGLFTKLCDLANHLAALRETYAPGSQPWCVLCQLVLALDQYIDWLVLEGDGLDDEGEDACPHR